MQLYDPKKANWECKFPLSRRDSILARGDKKGWYAEGKKKGKHVLTNNLRLDVSYVEGRIPKDFGSDAVEIPGARYFLSQLEDAGACWGVVTSGTRALIDGWLGILGLTHPKMLVVAEDVESGKPDPRCYLLGRKRLGLEHSSSLVVLEDAPSGIRAGKAAGFKVIALTTTHSLAQLQEAGADWIVEDLRSVSVKDVVDGRIELEIRNAYQ
jgi:glycerol 3-phosphatase-1